MRLAVYPALTISPSSLASSPGHSHIFDANACIENAGVAWGGGYKFSRPGTFVALPLLDYCNNSLV
jgi:hypothetical protein